MSPLGEAYALEKHGAVGIRKPVLTVPTGVASLAVPGPPSVPGTCRSEGLHTLLHVLSVSAAETPGSVSVCRRRRCAFGENLFFVLRKSKVNLS